MADGLLCPNCSCAVTSVIDSRPRTAAGGIQCVRRRRSCDTCDHRFSTVEILDDVDFGQLVDLGTIPFAARQPIRSLVSALRMEARLHG